MNRISKTTRKNIFDWLRVHDWKWYGTLDDIEFLSRIYDLDSLPSTDRRAQTIEGDIHRHRLTFPDWEDDWVYSDARLDLMGCNDEAFLTFLCEMLHPIVRPDEYERYTVLAFFNEEINNDGYEIIEQERISGLGIFVGRSILGPYKSLGSIKENASALNAEYLIRQINRIEKSIETEPEVAIGSAKELIETTSKTILRELSIKYESRWDIVQLVKTTVRAFDDVLGELPDPEKGKKPISSLINSLSAALHKISEIRNLYGTGHGKEGKQIGISPIYARLAVGAASTIAIFLLELYKRHKEKISESF